MTIPPLRLVPAFWQETFDQFLDGIRENALLSSPYVGQKPIEQLCQNLQRRGIAETVQLTLLTTISEENLRRGGVDAAALMQLCKEIPHTRLIHLPHLHAKVYLADTHIAVITSANLTHSGLYRNYEYGIWLQEPEVVRQIRADLLAYAALGAEIEKEILPEIRRHTERVHALEKQIGEQRDPLLQEAIQRALQRATQPVLEARARAVSENRIFAATVLYVLEREGPLTTPQLHQFIQAIHPDLCDDSVDRVIRGVHFGKRWKHMVRNAQQYLKRKGKVSFDGTYWKITSRRGTP